jgi:hypothetical protein
MKRFATLFLVLALTGCAARQKTVTGLPAGVTQAQVQSWDTAVANLHKIAATVSAARQAVIGLNKQGTFPDGPAYVVTLQSLGKIDEVEQSSVAYLDTVPQNWSSSIAATIQANMQTISGLIQAINSQGLTGIKDPNSLSQINTFISEITGFANIILSLATGS